MLLFLALVLTIFYVSTAYHNLTDGKTPFNVRCSFKGRIYYNNTQFNTERTGNVKIREAET